MRRLIALAIAACLATPVCAQEAFVSPRPDRVAIAVYRDRPVATTDLLATDPTYLVDQGLALIVETRTIDLPAGEGVIRFQGLATGIIPQTATLDGLPAHVVERNTDFDLLSPAALLQKSVGESVEVVRTNAQTGREETLPAIVRSGAAGAVLEIEGRVEALDCQGQTQRIVFDRVPEGLSDQPILSVRTRAEAAGRYTVTLAYLATGLQWSADYVARLNPDGTLDLTGWITLANFGGTGFPDAPVQVVAGQLNRDYETKPLEPNVQALRHDCWPLDTTTRGPSTMAGTATTIDYLATIPSMSNSLVGYEQATEIDEVVVTGVRIARESQLGDYKLYTLPEPTDVNARQTKQVRFLERPGVRYSRVYRYEVDGERFDEDEGPQRPEAILKLRNLEADGLGLALPGGGISVVEIRDGRALFAGETSLYDRAVGLPVELTLGEASGIAVSTAVIRSEEWWARDEQWKKLSLAVTVTNDQEDVVEVEIVARQQGWADSRILRSSQRTVVLDTGAKAWRVRVPPGESRELTYTIQFID